MKTLRNAAAIFIPLFVAACANPLNQETSERYAKSCIEAEMAGQLPVAEQACYRALVNVDLGNLGEAQKSLRMYNLARIKRQLGKFDEAEQLYKGSLAIEERLSPTSSERIGRRCAELAIVYGEQKRFEEGLPYVERLLPLADTYQGREKITVASIFYVYSQKMPKGARSEQAARLAKKAVDMGYDPKTYKN